MEKGSPKSLSHVWPLFRGFGGLYYAKLRWNRPKTKKAHISVWPNARKRCFDKLVLIWLLNRNSITCLVARISSPFFLLHTSKFDCQYQNVLLLNKKLDRQTACVTHSAYACMNFSMGIFLLCFSTPLSRIILGSLESQLRRKLVRVSSEIFNSKSLKNYCNNKTIPYLINPTIVTIFFLRFKKYTLIYQNLSYLCL